MKNILLHLRLPFSYFLLPVYIFALGQSTHIDVYNAVIIFIVLHFFIYPASNAYNSFMDKDTGSIGTLKNPPPVTRGIYNASILLDVTGLILSLLIDFRMTFLMMIYIIVSKGYSWTGLRLKKYPLTGWLVVTVFQGAYTFLLVSMAVENNFTPSWFITQKIEGMLLSTMLIGAYYPLTQIYQHVEDRGRGDITISFKLGVKGTFIFSAGIFLFSFLIALHYFTSYYNLNQFYIFGICIMPAIIFFGYWFLKSLQNISAANYSNTMKMTFISSTCLITGFIILLYENHWMV